MIYLGFVRNMGLKDEELEFDDFKIKKGSDVLIDTQEMRYFKEEIGNFNTNMYKSFCVFYLKNNDVVNNSKEHTTDNYYFSQFIRTFIFLFWVVKDNAVQIDTSYLYEVNGYYENDSYHKISLNKPLINYSNSVGEYSETELTTEVLKRINEYKILYDELPIVFSNVSELKGQYIQANEHKSYHNYDKFEKINRFIHEARNTSFLYSKILFYTSALEVLVVTNKEKVTTQVVKRVRWLLAEYSDLKVSGKELNKIYDSRSKYVHGSNLDNHLELKKISLKCDEILRAIIKSILEKKMPEEVLRLNKNDLDEWFKLNIPKNN